MSSSSVPTSPTKWVRPSADTAIAFDEKFKQFMNTIDSLAQKTNNDEGKANETDSAPASPNPNEVLSELTDIATTVVSKDFPKYSDAVRTYLYDFVAQVTTDLVNEDIPRWPKNHDRAEETLILAFRRDAAGYSDRICQLREDHLARKASQRVSAVSPFKTTHEASEESLKLLLEGKSGDVASALKAYQDWDWWLQTEQKREELFKDLKNSAGDFGSMFNCVRAVADSAARTEAVDQGSIVPDIVTKPSHRSTRSMLDVSTAPPSRGRVTFTTEKGKEKRLRHVGTLRAASGSQSTMPKVAEEAETQASVRSSFDTKATPPTSPTTPTTWNRAKRLSMPQNPFRRDRVN